MKDPAFDHHTLQGSDPLWLIPAAVWLLFYGVCTGIRLLARQQHLWVLEVATNTGWRRSGAKGDLTMNRCPSMGYDALLPIALEVRAQYPEETYRLRRVFRRQAILVDVL